MPAPSLGPFFPDNTPPVVLSRDDLPVGHVVHAYHNDPNDNLDPEQTGGLTFGGNTLADGQKVLWLDEGLSELSVWLVISGVPVRQATLAAGEFISNTAALGDYRGLSIVIAGGGLEPIVTVADPLLRSFSNTAPSTFTP